MSFHQVSLSLFSQMTITNQVYSVLSKLLRDSTGACDHSSLVELLETSFDSLMSRHVFTGHARLTDFAFNNAIITSVHVTLQFEKGDTRITTFVLTWNKTILTLSPNMCVHFFQVSDRLTARGLVFAMERKLS